MAGLPSTAGATSLAGPAARCDAPLVGRLRDAGAIILGTTNLSEWANIRSARSTSGWSAVGGLTGNPWALDRSPGGSSSGSGAAVAAGLAPLAIGTETDGSITCPASLNGVAGIKPTVGAVPTGGVVPISASQDSPGPHGPHRRRGGAAPGGADRRAPGILDRARAGVGGLRVGVGPTTWRTGHPATDELFDETVAPARGGRRAASATCSPPCPVPAEEEDELTVLLCELVDGLAAYLPTRGRRWSAGPRRGHRPREAPRRGGAGPLRTRSLRAGRRAGRASHPCLPGRPGPQPGLGGRDGCLAPAIADVDVLIAPTYGPAWKSDLVLGGHPAAGLTDHHRSRHRRLADRHRPDGAGRGLARRHRRRGPARFGGAPAGRVPGRRAARSARLAPARARRLAVHAPSRQRQRPVATARRPSALAVSGLGQAASSATSSKLCSRSPWSHTLVVIINSSAPVRASSSSSWAATVSGSPTTCDPVKLSTVRRSLGV